ncbi:MAG: hypothetical protein QOJ58_4389, partial [Alphaproteobacteria bacterium]|nr:hypothetical protein [Alphaproteobacteria bacterium]
MMITVMRVSTTAVESMVLTRMIMPVVVPMMRVHPMSVLRIVVMGMVMMHRRHGGPDGRGTVKAVQRRDECASLHPQQPQA